MKPILRRVFCAVSGLLLAGTLTLTIGCVRQSGGVWYFHEAKRPVGWPDLTPVGEVQLKQYPAYREAVVTRAEPGATQNAMFRVLFKHIQQSDIAMTAPVDMTYDPTAGRPEMRSMAFLYDAPDRGGLVQTGDVIVRDVPARQVVSVGVRGSYSDERFDAALRQLRAWLDEQAGFKVVGSPRYLGYNSPFVPFFWRYGEVQIPVETGGG